MENEGAVDRQESRPDYRKAMDRRPWKVGSEVAEKLRGLASKWLVERGGIVVYENHVFDSSAFGDRSFVPAQFVAQEDNQMHWAPLELRPYGGIPSRRQQQVDFIEMGDYPDTAVEKVIANAFAFGEE